VVFSGVQAGLELAGEFVESAGGVAHDEPGTAVASVAGRHAAGSASIFQADSVVACDLQTGQGKKAGYCGLLLVEAERFYRAGEVFNSVELVVADDDGDSYGVDIGVEDVFAVPFGVHPEAMNDWCIRGFGDVFGDKAEVSARVGSADGEFGFSGKLVGDVGVFGHLLGVVEGGLGKDWIKMELGKAVGGPFLIGCREKVLLGYFGGVGELRGCENRKG